MKEMVSTHGFIRFPSALWPGQCDKTECENSGKCSQKVHFWIEGVLSSTDTCFSSDFNAHAHLKQLLGYKRHPFYCDYQKTESSKIVPAIIWIGFQKRKLNLKRTTLLQTVGKGQGKWF